MVLAKLQENYLYVKVEKCKFHMQHTTFLSYAIDPEGVAMDQEKVKAVTMWPTPASIKDIHRCIGFANFYRRFIRGFSSIMTPLTALLNKP